PCLTIHASNWAYAAAQTAPYRRPTALIPPASSGCLREEGIPSMLCLRCATPLPPGSSACHRCGARAQRRSYSSALIVADTIPDPQPEIPVVRVTTLSSGVHAQPTEAARPVPATTQPVTAIRVSLAPTAPATPAPGEAYTLRHLLDATFGVPSRANRIFP